MDQEKVRDGHTAILLLAGRGTRIADLTTRPKCLLEVHGKSLLERHLEIWIRAGLKRAVVVLGYEAEQIEQVLKQYDQEIQITRVYNDDYIKKGNTYSLYLGLREVEQGCLIFDGDLIYTSEIFRGLLEDPKESAFLVGEASIDDIECAKALVDHNQYIRMTIDKRAITEDELKRYEFVGEAIGIIKLASEETKQLRTQAQEFLAEESNLPLNWEHLMNQFLLNREIHVVKTLSDYWVEIDNYEDFQKALSLFGEA